MRANSLSLPTVVVVLCFLLVVSLSHAACFDDCIKSVTEGSSPSAEAIAQVVGCTTKCALGERDELKTTEELISLDQNLPKCKGNPCFERCRLAPWLCARRCNCSLLASFANDQDQEMTEELISLDQNLPKCKGNPCFERCRAAPWLCAEICNCSLLASFANDHDQEMTEELISLDQNLPKCKGNPCFQVCRCTPKCCARLCNCSLLASFANDHDQEMTEEQVSLDEKLMGKCKYNLCYRACRQVGGGKAYCARNCNCSLLTLSTFELDRKVKMAEEEADDEASSAASA